MLCQWEKALESCIDAEEWLFGVWAQANCGTAKVIAAATAIASLFCIGNAPVFLGIAPPVFGDRPNEETWPARMMFRYKSFMIGA